MKFDCGNKTDDCNNATCCPCLLFIDKELKSYENTLKILKEIDNKLDEK